MRVAMDYRRKTEELNAIPIGRVASLLGISLRVGVSSRCPFDDHDDKTPSFTIFDKNNRWQCFGCGKRGGAIDLVKFYFHLSFIDARRWLLDQSSLNASHITPRSKIEKSPAQNNKVFIPEKIFSEVYEAFIQACHLSEKGCSYLLSRAISKKTISDFGITQIVDAKSCLSLLLKRFDFLTLQESGLLSVRSTSQNIKLAFFEGDLIFPYREGGRVVYLQSRCIECIGKRRWKNLSGIPQRIFNVDILNRKDINTIHICEGVIDTLSAYELGKDAIGLMGTSARLPVSCIQILKKKNVQILFDWDEAGEHGALALHDELLNHGVVSIRPLRPLNKKCDLNDYLRDKRNIL
jgi:DNA primase